MFKYWDIKDDNKLPPKSFFIDPYDYTRYALEPAESLSVFIKRIASGRAYNGAPILEYHELRALVVAFLEKLVPDKHLKDYFIEKATIPSASTVFSFASTIVRQMISADSVSQAQAENRATFCLQCPYHTPASMASNMVSFGVNKITPGKKEPLRVIIDGGQDADSLGKCGMCGCALKAKVRMGIYSIIGGILPEHVSRILRTLGLKAFKACWIMDEASTNPATAAIFKDKVRIGIGEPGLVFLNEHLKQTANGENKKD